MASGVRECFYSLTTGIYEASDAISEDYRPEGLQARGSESSPKAGESMPEDNSKLEDSSKPESSGV